MGILAPILSIVLAFAGCGDDERGTVEQSGSATGTTATTATETTGTETVPTETTGTGTTTTGAAGAGGEPVATIEVTETEYELNPRNPRVEEAGVVEFEVTNAGEIAHALEVEGPEGEVETEEIAPGDTATMTADLGRPGAYKWYCPIADHEDRGMVGRVFVAGGRRAGGDGSGGGGSGGRDDAGGRDDSERRDDSAAGAGGY